MKKQYHFDCEAYRAVDVFKGICSRTEEIVPADGEVCEEFKPVKKCRLCKHYRATGDHLGVCKDEFIAYPDLLAKTCPDFEG
jgi:hypothetical protein